MHFGFRSADSPHDALVKLSNFEVEEFLEVQKGDIIKAFSHMINTSRVIRVNYFNRLAFTLFRMSTVEFGHAETFRNF